MQLVRRRSFAYEVDSPFLSFTVHKSYSTGHQIRCRCSGRKYVRLRRSILFKHSHAPIRCKPRISEATRGSGVRRVIYGVQVNFVCPPARASSELQEERHSESRISWLAEMKPVDDPPVPASSIIDSELQSPLKSSTLALPAISLSDVSAACVPRPSLILGPYLLRTIRKEKLRTP